MSEAIITVVLTQLTTIMEQQIRKEIRLVSGVEKQVKKLTNSLQSIKAVLVDAERKQLNDQSIELWLENLKDVSYDTEDVLSEWLTSMLKAEIEGIHHDNNQSNPTYTKVCSFLTLPFLGLNRYVLRRDIAVKIREINARLDVIAIEKDRYKLDGVTGSECLDRIKTVAFVDVCEVQGRDVDMSVLLRKMLMLSKEGHRKGLNVVSIVGMGGIGKTTLAQSVYSSDAVDQYFVRKIWVCVSDPFDELRVAKAILEDIEGVAPRLFELETAVRKIREYVVGKRFLLVLDDVWDGDFRKWEQLFNSLGTGGAGSTILVTTRNEWVAKTMGSTYELRLGELSLEDSWALFSKIAFFEREREDLEEEFEGIGRRIAEKCKGLPLTIKTIASLMRFKKTLKDWEDVLSSEFWGFEEKAKGLFPPLMLSYYDLPSDLKRCFLFCAFFPKDHLIEATNLIKVWMAQGYMENEEIGQVYLKNLAMRSFFQVIEKTRDGEKILSVKMHDMIHDLAQYLTKNEFSIIEVHDDLERKMELLDKRVRHLTLIRAEDTHFPTIPNVEKLFTFWVQSFYDSPPIVTQFDKIEPEFFSHLARVRALDLSRNLIGELPKEIEKLIKLKYLNLSHNPFYELPSTLCDLYNLQTLKLSYCTHLQKLPRSIGKLINLRHLEIDGTDRLKALPKGISNMSSLQTLSKFIITSGDVETCGIEDLNNLNDLRGCLKMEGLGFVIGADKAKKANLMKKKQIYDMHLDFSSSYIQTRNQDEVIEALELHENVQVLQISEFGGTKLPNWISKLNNLETLTLQNCRNCTNLPHLGKLASLVTLNLDGMKNVKSFGLEFSGYTSFPKLKILKISNMEGLEEWEMIWQKGEIPSEDLIKIMPRLVCLKISQCKKLKALPSFIVHKTSIKKLRIYRCTLLQQLYNKENGEDWSKISHIKKIRIS